MSEQPTGAKRYGTGGGDAYYDAVKYGGYTGTREQFGRDQANFAENATAVAEAKEAVEQDKSEVQAAVQTFTEETVPAAVQTIEGAGDAQVERVTNKGTEQAQAVETVGGQQEQRVIDQGDAQVGRVQQTGTDAAAYVNEAGSAQIADINEAGDTQYSRVNSAGTTQVGNVNSAGSNQVQAVQQKGQEVLDSIPADYTELTGDVDNLKSAYDNIFIVSQNMLNWNTLVLGHSVNASGVSVENASYKHSDYIKVTPRDTIWFKAWVNVSNYDGLSSVAFYTSNTEESFIARYTYGDGAVHSQVIPNGINYIRVNIYKDAAPQMINTGTALLPYTPYGEVVFNKNVIRLPNIENTIVVEQGGKGNYTTVAEAVASAVNGDTVLVMPGTYEDEIIKAWGKTVHIVGISKESCIIKNATGTYSAPPIEMGAGSLENLTVIAEEGTSTDQSGWRNYAVHVEDNNLFGKTLTIVNCNLISYNAPAIGIGLKGGSTVSIENCNLIGKTSSGGSLFFHDSAIVDYSGIQNIEVINCDMRSEGTAEPTLKVTSQCVSGATVNVRFLKNNVFNTNGISYEISSNNTDGTPSSGSYSGNPWRNLVNFNLTEDCFGNRKPGMNYTA